MSVTVIAQVAIVLLVCHAAGRAMSALGQPRVIGEMIGGILLGPSLFGRAFSGLAAALFPPDDLRALEALSYAGLAFFMLVVGMDLDLRILRTVRAAGVAISLTTISVPFGLGLLVAHSLRPAFGSPGVAPLMFQLFVATALSITAFPVLVRIVRHHRLAATELGTLAVACAAVDDVIGWSILASIAATAQAGDGVATGIRIVAILAAYLATMIYLVRPALARLTLRLRPRFPAVEIGVVLLVAFVSATATNLIGVHALFGAFVTGLIVPRDSPAVETCRRHLAPLVNTWLLPIFFAFTGLRMRLPALEQTTAWRAGGLLLGVAIAGKAGAGMLAGRATGLGWRDAYRLGLLLNTRGLMELVVLNIGLDLGILPPTLFAILVIVALITTAMTSPLLSLSSGVELSPAARTIPKPTPV